MQVVHTAPELRAALAGTTRTAFVPTMGNLHAGHVSLVEQAKQHGQPVVASVFVNPLQFGAGEDFDRYPRDLDADAALLERAGADLVFTPATADFTPPDRLTTVHVARLTDVLEGASRPGHFNGVATIVTKLFNTVQPDRAYFGEKDFQQLAVIRRMVADLDQPVDVVGCPIIRDDDGLALSSRNAYLSAEQRAAAMALPRALHETASAFTGDADAAVLSLRRTLEGASGVRLDYAEVVDPETLAPLEGVVEGPAQALVAAYVGDTRLIDNIRLEPKGVAP
jgi:pantoate--beta-alanine ligase